MSPRVAAAYIAKTFGLAVSSATVRRWARDGHLPSTRDTAGRYNVVAIDVGALFVPLGHD